MPNTKTISAVYKDQERSFLKHLKGAKSLEEEKIHKLRVDVKRLRSLFKFLEVMDKNKFSRRKAMKLFAPVFKAAGKIRTTTLNLKMTRSYRTKAIAGFKKYLLAREKQEEKDLRKEIKAFNKNKFKKIDKKTFSLFNKAGQNAVEKNSSKFLEDLFVKIRKDMPDISKDENFHDVRKKLKDVKTISKLLEDVAPKKTGADRQKKVEVVEEKIGKWHDSVILAEELEKFIGNNDHTKKGSTEHKKQQKENERLAMLVLDIKAHNEATKKLIAQQLRKNLLLN